ncbi:TVP38/TMEM64 family protein [Patulibacter sp.]|uniref:TVP38/TMEM64 family protein n=1 Tax=Patulibacter sp. TaxID=1912859 RepID=UPI002727F06B|nr:VTT domain-containing protein [Patulibacter sp.]MDO9409478.1 VTT domain-containing protein [Patulibacter sp.]
MAGTGPRSGPRADAGSRADAEPGARADPVVPRRPVVGPRTVAAVATVAITAGLLALVLAVPPLHDALGHALDGDTGALRDQLRDLGVAGALVLVTLVLVHTVIPYPAELALAVAGYVYGFWIGVPLMLVSWLLTGLLGYALGRWIGTPAARRLFGRDRVDRLAGMLEHAGAFPLLASRLVPIVPFTLASIVPGALGVPVRRFAWTTVVGYVPLTCIVVLLGGRLEHLSADDPLLWAAVAAILGMLAVARPLLRRVERRTARDRGAGRGPGDPPGSVTPASGPAA